MFEIVNLNKDFRFKVALGEIEVAQFREVQGLRITKEVLEYYEGGQNDRFHKLIGGTRHTPIVLGFGSSASTEFYDWVKQGLQGTIERKNGSIMAINQDGTVIARWEFRGAWPMGYQGPEFDHLTREVGIERLVLAHEGFFMQKETDAEARNVGGLQEGDDAGVSKGQDEGAGAGGLPGDRTRQVRSSCKADGIEVWDDDDAGAYLDDYAAAQNKPPEEVKAASVGKVMIIRPEHSDDPGLMRQEQAHIHQNASSSDAELQSGEGSARREAGEEDLTDEEREQLSDERAAASSDPGYHP